MINSILSVANKLNIKEQQVQNTVQLLQQGATVPFISRYRKNETGGLDEEQVAAVWKIYNYDLELTKRKEAVIKILEEKGLLTDDLKNTILSSSTKQEVENIYEPFKIGKKTKASDAIAMGLEPLAKLIMQEASPDFNVFNECKKYFNETLQTTDQVLEQVKYIIAQIISQDPNTRKFVKENLMQYGIIETSLKKEAVDEKEVFRQYYTYREKIKYIPNHRILAITRGEDKKILNYDITYNDKPIIYHLRNMYYVNKRTAFIVYEAIDDSLKRLLLPSIIREIKSDLFARAEEKAIKIFAFNLEKMLLAPATKNKKILAIDPAYVNGSKIAVLDENGNLKAKRIIFPNPPQNKTEESAKVLNELILEHNINLIVIGNGTASRETEQFVSNFLKERHYRDIKYAIVSEIGASVYSASKLAQEEFPTLSVEERSAISIGRRFQDPLNELIKIDPKSIGVGQYQHDVDQKELSSALEFKIQKVVNEVGVDLNTATYHILSFISGLTKTLAKNIIDYRNKNSNFNSREELKNVKGISDKIYEQCIGFLRIFDSKVFYDRTNIHPESYKLANKLVEYLKLDLNKIDSRILEHINEKKICEDLQISEYDLNLIVDSLKNPGKDIRDDKNGFLLQSEVKTIDDLKIGQILPAQILNITDFGAFAFLGIKQTALIHVSHMKRSEGDFIAHPADVVSVGQNVNIKIIEIDKTRDRIQGEIVW
ncbi:Tex-like N-terminal domain-containing protein [Metamycoplasma hyosynoviae]|uniref:Tex-like N-terminal domain-containing protein n=1 Tax=Metamycoplasma hyosynoviae TaxID=29559 RepID=UPI0023625D4D|nr:Tex-like N-terminal domain-containing protein [Metamycoplasma hyosynoviae]MDD1374795.1 Tex-like N-terminal domain-containing protein [Metamycoplasma hyosynoviae]